MDQTSRHSGLTRRTFLKTSALTAGALAAAGAAGCSSVSTEAPVEETSQTADEKVYAGSCRGNCGGCCILDVKVREGKITSTMPRVIDHEGMDVGCVRGVSNIARIYGPGRVLHPMKRVEGTPRGAGEWEQISWDEAFSLIAEKFQSAMDEHGAESIGAWIGTGAVYDYANGGMSSATPGIGRFMQKTGITQIDHGNDRAGCYFQYVVTLPPTPSPETAQYSKTIVLWGSNPAAAGAEERTIWYWMCKARENGAKIITIDPLFTQTAAQSDTWIPIRVGTDGALMCAMIHYIVDNKLYDEDYLRNGSVAPLLTKEDGSYLRLSDLGMDPDEVENDKTGKTDKVDSPVVWDEADQKFVSHRGAKNPAYTGTFDANGITVRTAFDVSLESIAPFDIDYAVRECGIPAEQIIELAETCVQGMPTFLHVSFGIEHTYNCFHLYLNAAMLASLIGCCGTPGTGYFCCSGKASRIWKNPISVDTSATVVEGALQNKMIMGEYLIDIMKTGKWNGEDTTFKALYIQAHDPLDNGCAPTEMIETWDKIGFVVTADQFMTTSAQYSDLVLPVATGFESEGFETQVREPFLRTKAIEPLGESKCDYDIWRGIAAAMGYDDLYPWTVEELLRQYLDTPENIEAGVAYDDYAAAGGAIMGEYVYAENPPVEHNDLGRTKFYLESWVPRLQTEETIEPHDRLPYYKPAIEAYLDNPDREKYPLFGFSNHDAYHGQSMHAHSQWLDQFRKLDGSPFCRIHETAAAERGIKTGDMVRCFNSHGYVVLRAVVTKGIREDSVWLPHGFYADEFVDGFAQSLTGHNVDPQTQNANFNDMILQVEKYEGGAE